MSRITIALLLALAMLAAHAARAADTVVSKDAPDLASVRAKIKAKDYAGALTEVKPLVEKHDHADVYNLYAFTSRKTGDRKTAATYYAKALELDPKHRGALEYQGEMFVESGDMTKARANLAQLATLCPSGCEEREDLEKAIKAQGRKK